MYPPAFRFDAHLYPLIRSTRLAGFRPHPSSRLAGTSVTRWDKARLVRWPVITFFVRPAGSNRPSEWPSPFQASHTISRPGNLQHNSETRPTLAMLSSTSVTKAVNRSPSRNQPGGWPLGWVLPRLAISGALAVKPGFSARYAANLRNIVSRYLPVS